MGDSARDSATGDESERDNHSEPDRGATSEEPDDADSSVRATDAVGDRRVSGDSAGRDDPDDPEGSESLDVTVTFLNCRQVHVVGSVSDVILRVSFDPSDGIPGTITEPIGGVDEERTIDAAVEFDLPPGRTVITEVELFEGEEVATPGLGVLHVENPTVDACLEERLGFGADDADHSIEYLDCETVRVTGTFADVLLSFAWWDENGTVGTISEPVGGVDGERTIVASEEFGEFAYGPVLSSVHAFVEGTPVVPGGGDLIVENPAESACRNAVVEAYDGPGVPDGV